MTKLEVEQTLRSGGYIVYYSTWAAPVLYTQNGVRVGKIRFDTYLKLNCADPRMKNGGGDFIWSVTPSYDRRMDFDVNKPNAKMWRE